MCMLWTFFMQLLANCFFGTVIAAAKEGIFITLSKGPLQNGLKSSGVGARTLRKWSGYSRTRHNPCAPHAQQLRFHHCLYGDSVCAPPQKLFTVHLPLFVVCPVNASSTGLRAKAVNDVRAARVRKSTLMTRRNDVSASTEN
jgi:hypothetical protein